MYNVFEEMLAGNKYLASTHSFAEFEKRGVKVFETKDLVEIQLNSTSKGNQRKWIADNTFMIKEQFFYQNVYWKDYLVEVIASTIASQMTCNVISVLEQRECIIRDSVTDAIRHGVYSSLWDKNLRFVSYSRLCDEVFDNKDTIENKWNIVIETIKNATGLDCTEYLIVMSLIDYIVGNEDRHLNNFGVFYNESTYRFEIATLFDFGLGLFEHDRLYEDLSFRKCVESMQCKPFYKNNEKVIDWISLNYDIGKYFKNGIDLSNVVIPSPKAGSYLRNRCIHLGVHLTGVE